MLAPRAGDNRRAAEAREDRLASLQEAPSRHSVFAGASSCGLGAGASTAENPVMPMGPQQPL